MPQYALMVWGPSEHGEFGTYETADEDAAQMRDTAAFTERLRREGSFVFVGGLAEASASTVVDGRAGAPVMTDGPYIESKEYLAGFWIVDAADLDVALDLAADASRACRRAVEVRPLGVE